MVHNANYRHLVPRVKRLSLYVLFASKGRDFVSVVRIREVFLEEMCKNFVDTKH